MKQVTPITGLNSQFPDSLSNLACLNDMIPQIMKITPTRNRTRLDARVSDESGIPMPANIKGGDRVIINAITMHACM